MLPFQTQAGIFTYHASLLGDAVRMDAFARAIAAVVRPGMSVLDLGCGTGVLACLAARAGAAPVWAVESGPVIGLARAVARQNGLADRITFLAQGSLEAQLPRVDVVVSETLGNVGVDEGLLDWFLDARARLLKPGGVLVPRALELWAAPVETPALMRPLEVWGGQVHGVSFDLRDLAQNNVYTATLGEEALLGAPASLGRVELGAFERPVFQGGAGWTIGRAGVMHGLGGWFSAELADGIAITNAPPNRAPNWSHEVFAVAPAAVQAGDRVDATIEAAAAGTRWSWDVRVTRADGSASAGQYATLFGFPL